MNSKKNNGEHFTASGIPLKSYYTPEDISGLDYEKDIGAPGKAPFTRGSYPEMYRSRYWGIKQLYGHGTLEEMNERYKHQLEMGQDRLTYVIDNPTLYGLDTDDPRVGPWDAGVMGMAVNSVRDLEVWLKDIPIDKVHLDRMNSASSSLPWLALHVALFDKWNMDLKNMRGACHSDMVIAYISANQVDPIPPHACVKLFGDLVEWAVENCPSLTVFGTTPGYNARETGINAYQELAIGFAQISCQIEEVLGRKRLGIDDFAKTIGFHLSSDRDFFEEIAKFRAGRRMWYKLMKERYNAQAPNSLRYRVHVQTAGSSLIYQQPLNNIARIAYEVLAAALGGVQSICCNSYLEPICEPTEESELISIRTQQIAQHETNITNVIDPLAGSYFIEWLTDELEKRAWDYLQKIEDMGGFLACLESGWLDKEFKDAMYENEKKVANGEKKVVGVNCFQMDEEPYSYDPLPTPSGCYDIQIERLAKLRSERNNNKVKECLEEVHRASREGRNVMPPLIEAAKAEATLGEMCNVFREEYGIFRYASLV